MKKYVCAIAALAAAFCASSANAQSYRATPQYNWTGCYVGASAGGTWGEVETNATVSHSNVMKPNGFIGGGQLGCDYQAPSNWVFGLQGEFNWADARDSQNYPTIVLSSGTFDARTDWFASATARVGYAHGPWLIYGKGGAAWVRDRFKDAGTSIGTFSFSGDVTRSGWTGGGGFEYAFSPNWSAVLEYDYYGFGTKSINLPGFDFLGPGVEPVSFKQNFSVVKVGINYRFSTGR